MLTGVNNSLKENKFVSGVYKLVEGEHLINQDKNKILMHKDLAKKRCSRLMNSGSSWFLY